MLGLLVAACVNRAPEGTFGAAVADVGVLDMLKVCKHPVHFFFICGSYYLISQFHKFTIGKFQKYAF